jgi:protein-L-isoaspartate(D-aspartate) O-methyltransferase
MNFEKARFNMVEQQIRPWEVLDFDVLDLLMSVRREEFVPEAYKSLALSEAEIPLGHGASMLIPVIEGKILQAIQVKRSDKVLEVGAGSGYFAALLAARADWVRTVEIEPALVTMAHENLKRYGVENVIVEEGDAIRGWPSNAPYDLIVVSGGVPYPRDPAPADQGGWPPVRLRRRAAADDRHPGHPGVRGQLPHRVPVRERGSDDAQRAPEDQFKF